MPRNNHTVQTFFAQLGPGLITGAADDDPSGIATYSVTGAGFGYGPLWTALFCFPLMAAVQLMCSRLGMVIGPRAGRGGPQALFALGAVGRLPAADCGQRDQHRRRPGRHGGSHPDGDRHPFRVDDAGVRRADCRGAALDFLSLPGAYFQMAHAGAVRLRDHGIPGATGLGRGPARHVCAGYPVDQRVPVGAGGNSGHQHLTVSFLLAGRAGSGGRARRWPEHRGKAPGRYGRGIAARRAPT